nr:iron chelate uptake ABC transporter family permease subunit [Salmonella enterica]
MGPASAVAAAVSDTATSISIRRDRSTLTPSAQALSSPISSSRIRRTSSAAPLIMVMLTGAALLVRRMRLLEMGDDSACALGVSVERSRLMLMLVAVSLTAAATALAGPISFIALVAPHIARRLSGTARWGLTQSALCGALLLLAADACAQQLFMPYQLPVGVVTVSLGGIYLIVLLIQESRKK